MTKDDKLLEQFCLIPPYFIFSQQTRKSDTKVPYKTLNETHEKCMFLKNVFSIFFNMKLKV